jgi:hypothetical protein
MDGPYLNECEVMLNYSSTNATYIISVPFGVSHIRDISGYIDLFVDNLDIAWIQLQETEIDQEQLANGV